MLNNEKKKILDSEEIVITYLCRRNNICGLNKDLRMQRQKITYTKINRKRSQKKEKR